MTDQPRGPIEWSIAKRCRDGETTSGDSAVVCLRQDGVLVAVFDGLGHGPEAARGAQRAADVVRSTGTQDLVALTRRCHEALSGTRGAALTLAFLSSARRELSWLGVGNVEGRLISGDPRVFRLKASLAAARGVPGHELPPVAPETLRLSVGDLLILATDGIRATFADSLDSSGSTEAISERILSAHGKRPDDALVVTLRYLGPGS